MQISTKSNLAVQEFLQTLMHLTEHKRSLGRDANSNAAWIFSVIPSDGMHKSGPQKIIQGLTKPMMVSFCCRKERNSCFQGTLAVRPH